MADSPPHSWLIAAWPGMGNVAVLAAGYLIQQLKLRPVNELTIPAHFDVQSVDVKKGIVATPRLPQSLIFRPPKPLPRETDLTVFVGEAQPAIGSFAFARTLLDRVAEYKPTRIVTFASMASQMHPTQPARVYGAATQGDLLDELRRLEVTLLEDGQIGGMNGLLLGAAAERGLAGLCLLGEIPYFAAGVANPKAARAVLDAFSLLSGIEVDLEELGRHAERVDHLLAEMLERMQAQEAGESPEAEAGATSAEASAEPKPPAPTGDAPIDPVVQEQIERLFAEAAKDRSKAMRLKRELDRHGLFKRYENRFLDLFKRAE